MSSSKTRWSSIGTNLSVGAISLIVAVLGAEGCLRLFQPAALSVVMPGLYELDPPRRYRLHPGYRGELSNVAEFTVEVDISARGLRDEDAPAKPDGEARLLVLGDSYTFGWGVEQQDAFPARLETHLESASRPWRVLNGGVPGYGLPDEAAWLAAYGLDLDPDVVLVAVFLGNDLLDATEEHRRIAFEDGLIDEVDSARGARAWLYRHSHLVRLTKRALPFDVQIRLRQAVGLPLPWAITYLRDSLQVYALEPTDLVLEGRASTRAAFSALLSSLQAKDILPAMVLVPDQREVDPALWHHTLDSLHLDPDNYSAGAAGAFFLEMAAESGVPCLDLRPALRAAMAQTETPLYFKFDPHWTAAAHELAAQEIKSFLAAEGLLGVAVSSSVQHP